MNEGLKVQLSTNWRNPQQSGTTLEFPPKPTETRIPLPTPKPQKDVTFSVEGWRWGWGKKK